MVDSLKMESALEDLDAQCERLSRDELEGWDWMDDVGTVCPLMLARAIQFLVMQGAILGYTVRAGEEE